VVVDPTATNNPHSAAIRFVGEGQRVLEVGCWSGHVTEHLVARGNTVVGVELDPAAAADAEAFAARVHVADIDLAPLSTLEEGPFDVIVLGDVLEHLRDPAASLADATTLLAPDGRLVISVPHVAHVDVRMMLLQGQWTYQDDGLLDRTHLRWFTRQSLRELLAGVGFVATRVERIVVPFGATNLCFDRAVVPHELIEFALADPEATTLQFVVEARRSGNDLLANDEPVAWPPLADTQRLADLQAERDALAAEVEAWHRSLLVRGSAPLRRVWARIRR